MHCDPSGRALSGPCDGMRTFRRRSCRQSSSADIGRRQPPQRPLHCDWPADGQRPALKRHGHGRPYEAWAAERRQRSDDGASAAGQRADAADGADADDDAVAAVAGEDGGVAAADGAPTAHCAPWFDDHHGPRVLHAHPRCWAAVAAAVLSWASATVLLALDDHAHCWTPSPVPRYGCGYDAPPLPLPLQRSSARSHPN